RALPVGRQGAVVTMAGRRRPERAATARVRTPAVPGAHTTGSTPMTLISRIAALAGRWFALLVLAAGAVGLFLPEQTAPLAEYTSLFLAVIMFGMGLTLRPADFGVVLTHPKAALIGMLCQYTVMPLLGWAVAHALDLPPMLVVGMILVGAAPAGTASNVIVYLARGDVALSVAMTSVSTMLAPVLTPLLVLALAGRTLEVPAGDMFGT